MEKKYFLYKLYPPRPTFHSDQNEEEKSVMQQHMQYWAEITNKGRQLFTDPYLTQKGFLVWQ